MKNVYLIFSMMMALLSATAIAQTSSDTYAWNRFETGGGGYLPVSLSVLQQPD
jgi:hypothetical protein